VYREDYILRLIEQLVAFVAHVARLNRGGEHDKALATADQAWGKLLDAPRELIDAVDTPTLAGMLREPAKIRAAAHLLTEESRALAGKGDAQAAATRLRRALELFLEARAMDPPKKLPARRRAALLADLSEQDDAAIQELLREVPVETLEPRYRTLAGAST
jgi:hypothetical protein